MPAKKKVKKHVPPKIFKVQKKRINDNPNNFVVRFKGDWDKTRLKEFKEDLDYFCQHYLEQTQEAAYDKDEQRERLEEKRPIMWFF